MNRRKFLFSAGTASMAATMGIGARRLFAQNAPDPNIYNASIAAHAIAAGNGLYVGTSSGDWGAVMSTLNNCATEWASNGRDGGVAAAMANISPTMITSSALDQTTILQNLQVYQPQFLMSDLQAVLSFIDTNQALVPQVLATMQQGQFSSYITGMAGQAKIFSFDLARMAASGGGNSISAVGSMMPGGLRPIIPPSKMSLPSNGPGDQGGGGGYNCATDGALIFAAGIAFATLSVMTLGSVDVLAGAAWAGIALWGGIGTTGWGAAHVISGCGF